MLYNWFNPTAIKVTNIQVDRIEAAVCKLASLFAGGEAAEADGAVAVDPEALAAAAETEGVGMIIEVEVAVATGTEPDPEVEVELVLQTAFF